MDSGQFFARIYLDNITIHIKYQVIIYKGVQIHREERKGHVIGLCMEFGMTASVWGRNVLWPTECWNNVILNTECKKVKAMLC